MPRTPSDLPSHQSVIYAQGGGGAAWTFRKGTSEETVTLNGRARISAAEGVRAAVLSGLGLAVSSEWMFAPELADGTLHVVLAEWDLPDIDLWAVFPTGRRVSAKARAFIDFVEARLRASSLAR
jgi:DNA-binding transcriptional LysR family regulator